MYCANENKRFSGLELNHCKNWNCISLLYCSGKLFKGQKCGGAAGSRQHSHSGSSC